MSGKEGYNGYYLQRSGERVNQLLSRQFVVPTLEDRPNESTLSWLDGDYEVVFRVGEFVRVPSGDDFVFYRLKDIKDGVAAWDDATSADMSDYYTKKEVDDKIANLVISGGSSGGVELISEEDYASKKENGEIVDNIMYFIVVDDEPYELYIGHHLIGKKGEIENLAFPYTFPIIF